MSKAILTARGVSKHFGGLTAVDEVDFEVSAGEVVALLGDNGAGKSTLIKCISGVYRPEQGTVMFNGEDITQPRAGRYPQPRHRNDLSGPGAGGESRCRRQRVPGQREDASPLRADTRHR